MGLPRGKRHLTSFLEERLTLCQGWWIFKQRIKTVCCFRLFILVSSAMRPGWFLAWPGSPGAAQGCWHQGRCSGTYPAEHLSRSWGANAENWGSSPSFYPWDRTAQPPLQSRRTRRVHPEGWGRAHPQSRSAGGPAGGPANGPRGTPRCSRPTRPVPPATGTSGKKMEKCCIS